MVFWWKWVDLSQFGHFCPRLWFSNEHFFYYFILFLLLLPFIFLNKNYWNWDKFALIKPYCFWQNNQTKILKNLQFMKFDIFFAERTFLEMKFSVAMKQCLITNVSLLSTKLEQIKWQLLSFIIWVQPNLAKIILKSLANTIKLQKYPPLI